MKLITFLLFINLVLYSATGFTQNENMTLAYSNVPLKEVLNELEDNSDFKFLYREDYIDDQLVSIDVKNVSIITLMDNLLEGTGTSYHLLDNKLLVITPLEESMQQQLKITGTITDENTGEPLPGVNIVIKGTTAGAISDLNGNYTIEVTNVTDVLVYSFIGYESKEIVVGEKTVIDIELEPALEALEEVVVVGYGVQKKINVTGSVATVEADQLIKTAAANSSELVSGKIAGVITKQTSGVPGSDNTTIKIRGYAGDPLVLVDGIEMSFNRIDPNDIESVSVLKDASAAIYGSRAGNGVILVTTKRGSIGKPKINYHGNLSFQQPTIFPRHVDSWQWAQLWREAEGNDDTYTEEDVQKYKDGGDPDFPNYNWQDAIFVDWTPMQQHNLSVRGGNEKVKYFTSVGYLDQESSFKSGDLSYQGYSLRSNVDAAISKSLTATFDLSYRMENRKNPGHTLHETWVMLNTAQPIYPAELPDPSKAAYSGFSQRSPLAATQKEFSGFIDDQREFITGKLKLDYKIPFVSGLSVNGEISYFSKNKFRKNLDQAFDVWSYSYELDSYNWEGTSNLNYLREELDRDYKLIPKIAMEYNKNFGDHNISGLILGEAIDEWGNIFIAERENLLSYEVPYLFAGSDVNILNDGRADKAGRASMAGRLNYNFREKYLFEGTFRRDASYNFPENSRWGFFPSVSAGWRISEEPFISGLDFINNLKLRVSYSRTGYDVIKDDEGELEEFLYLSGYEIVDPTYYEKEGYGYYLNNTSPSYFIGGQPGRLLTPGGIPNTEITWESMETYNMGVEAALWGGKLAMEFDLFYRKRTDILEEPIQSIPGTFGADIAEVNINSQDDRGFEILLTHENKIGDIRYSVSGNVGLGRAKWIHKEEDINFDDPDDVRINQESGHWVNRQFGLVSDGIFMSQEELENNYISYNPILSGDTLHPGDIRYKDLNNDSVIDWKDQDVIGYKQHPELSYGINLFIEFKGLSITALFQGASMFSMNFTGAARSMFSNNSTPLTYQWKYRWEADPENPGVNINPDAQLPAASFGSHANNNPPTGNNSDYRGIDFWRKDITYLRLKNLNINYDLPDKIINKIGIERLSVYVAGSNLWTISNLGIFAESFDPEGPNNQNARQYPPLRTITMGINLTL